MRRLVDYKHFLTYAMLAANSLYFAIGGVLIGIGVWMLVEKNFLSTLMGNALMTASLYVIVSAGCVIVAASLVGCCGSRDDDRGHMVRHISLLSVAYTLLLIGGCLAVAFRFRKNVDVRMHMKETLVHHYGVNLNNRWNNVITEAWDKAQNELYCCGVEDQSWIVYRRSAWFMQQPAGEIIVPPINRKHVPESCCARDIDGRLRHGDLCQKWRHGPPAKASGRRNHALHYRGCYEVGITYVYMYTGYLIGMSFGFSFVILFGLVVSVLRCRRARPGDYCGVRTAPLEVSDRDDRDDRHRDYRHRDDHHRDDRDDRHRGDRHDRDDRHRDDRHRDDRDDHHRDDRDDRHRDDRHRDDRHRDDRVARQARDIPAQAEQPRQPVYCERSSDGWFS